MSAEQWDGATFIVTTLRNHYVYRDDHEPTGIRHGDLTAMWGSDDPPLDQILDWALGDDRIHTRGDYYIFGPDPEDTLARPEKTFHMWLKDFLSYGFDGLNPTGRPIYDFAHDWQYDPVAFKGRAVTYERVFWHLESMRACEEAVEAFDYAWACYWTGKTPATA